MRTAFIQTLSEAAEEDERIWLICADLGYSVLEVFAERFPNRYVNVGVAEQNMIGIATGLALSGKTVFTYSMVNFSVMRCLEQIRNDVCYHNLSVKIVAVGGGLVYGEQGYSHHGVEDLAVMRVLPNMSVIAPGDPVEAALATKAIATTPGPCYLRLSKAGEPTVHQTIPEFAIGKAIVLSPGSDITLITCGGMLDMSWKVANELGNRSVSAHILSMPTICPLDQEAIIEAADRTGRIIVIEEHGVGGLGSAVAETLATSGRSVGFRVLGLKPEGFSLTGSHRDLLAAQGLTVEGVMQVALSMVNDVKTHRARGTN